MVQNSTNKLLFAFFYILLANFEVFSQNGQQSLEEKAFIYFCKRISSSEKASNAHTVFLGASSGVPAKVYDLAQCLNHINIFKDSIPNRAAIDSLKTLYENGKNQYRKIKISYKCPSIHKKRPFLKNNFYELFLYNAVLYEGYYYVEIILLNEKLKHYIVFGIRFDENRNVIDHCKYHTTYE